MKKSVGLMFMMSMVLLMVAGCGAHSDVDSPKPVNICFVAGIADNEKKVKEEEISELQKVSSIAGSTVTFITVEGIPAMIGDSVHIPDLSGKGYTKVMVERQQAGIRADIIERISNYEPSTPEMDGAAAITKAVRVLKANSIEGRKDTLVNVWSGKTTTGIIDMTEIPVYQVDLEASVKAAAEKMAGCDMSFIDEIVWYCAGDLGEDEQPPFSLEEKEKLKEFYKDLFIALGADENVISFKDDLPDEECYAFPQTPVSTIKVKGTESALKLSVLEESTLKDTSLLEHRVMLPEAKVKFQPDSAEFLSLDSAREAILPVIDYMKANQDINILLYATCAGETETEYASRLAEARAEALKALMVEAEISQDRITALGVKPSQDPFYEYNMGTGEAGAVNRKAIILDQRDVLAKEILDGQS